MADNSPWLGNERTGAASEPLLAVPVLASSSRTIRRAYLGLSLPDKRRSSSVLMPW